MGTWSTLITLSTGQIVNISNNVTEANREYWMSNAGDHIKTIVAKVDSISGVGVAEATVITFGTGDTTPTISQSIAFKTGNAATTEITGLDGGPTGKYKRITIMFNDNFTTIKHTASNISLQGSLDFGPSQQYDIMELAYYGQLPWLETSRSLNSK